MKNIYDSQIKYHNENIFIMGKHQTGKSSLIKDLTDKKQLRLSPYVSSALNLYGETLLGFLKRSNSNKKYIQEEIKLIDTLVIDDISAVSAHELDLLDNILKKFKQNNDPFGGMYLIFACNPYCTESNTTNPTEFSYFFHSKAFIDSQFRVIKTKQNKIKDPFFEELLDRFVEAKLTEEDITLLNSNVLTDHFPDLPIITAHHEANLINNRIIFASKGTLYCSRAKVSKKFSWDPMPQDLRFKIGSQVFLSCNNEELRDKIYVESVIKHSQNVFSVKLSNQLIIENMVLKNGSQYFEQLPLHPYHAIDCKYCYGRKIKSAVIDNQKIKLTYTLLSRFSEQDQIFFTRKISKKILYRDYNLAKFAEDYDGYIKNSRTTDYPEYNKEIKIAIFSDLHLEYNKFHLNCSEADILILAGDICPADNYRHEFFIKSIAENFREKPIIYIFGNHEYYTYNTMKNAEKNFLNSICRRYTNVHVLNNESINIHGIEFFGGTMWTDFKNGNKDFIEIAKKSLSDFEVIKSNENSILTPEQTVKMHQNFYNSLVGWIKNIKSGTPKIIISHHSPILDDKSSRDPLLYSFCATDMKAFIKNYKPDFWIYGHTHTNIDQKIGVTHIVSNQHGYGQPTAGFNAKGKIITITTDK